MDEIWRAVVGYPPHYEVSNLGRVRSWRAPAGRGLRESPFLMSPSPSGSGGYPSVCLSNDNTKRTIFVHILVCEAFHGPRPAGMEARHFPDGNKNNCRADNLSWSDHVTNIRDKAAHGTAQRGERNPVAKLTEDQARTIASSTRTGADLAREFGVSRSAVSKIRTGKNWPQASTEVA